MTFSVYNGSEQLAQDSIYVPYKGSMTNAVSAYKNRKLVYCAMNPGTLIFDKNGQTWKAPFDCTVLLYCASGGNDTGSRIRNSAEPKKWMISTYQGGRLIKPFRLKKGEELTSHVSYAQIRMWFLGDNELRFLSRNSVNEEYKEIDNSHYRMFNPSIVSDGIFNAKFNDDKQFKIETRYGEHICYVNTQSSIPVLNFD